MALQRLWCSLLALASAMAAAECRQLNMASQQAKPRSLLESTGYVLNPFMVNLTAAPLSVDSQWGTVQSPSTADFPVLAASNMQVLHVVLQPCTIYQPSYHPDASEMIIPISGEFVFTVIDASTLPYTQYSQAVGPGTAINVPTGTVHILENRSCEPAALTAVFDSSKPSRTELGPVVQQMPLPAVTSVFGLSQATAGALAQGLAGTTSETLLPNEDCAAECGL